ncbi:MAG: hypothetical protein AAF264_08030 [Pseudomonadota bacterium]
MRSLTAATILSLPLPAMAESYSVTVVAGYPPVFRWVRMLDAAFYPAVNAALAEHGHDMTLDGQ